MSRSSFEREFQQWQSAILELNPEEIENLVQISRLCGPIYQALTKEASPEKVMSSSAKTAAEEESEGRLAVAALLRPHEQLSTLEERVAYWQQHFKPPIPAEITVDWSELPTEQRHRILSKLTIPHAKVIATVGLTTDQETFYQAALETPAAPAGSWLELLVASTIKVTDTQLWLDEVFALLKSLTPNASPGQRLARYLDPKGEHPALERLASQMSLCSAGHFSGYWQAPASRYLLASIEEPYAKSKANPTNEPAPTLAEQIINHLALVDPTVLTSMATRLCLKEPRITSQIDLNRALLHALLPEAIAERLLERNPRCRECDCNSLCTLCKQQPAERWISGLDPDWKPQGRANVCKNCRYFGNVGRQRIVDQKLVYAELLAREAK